MKVCKKCKKHVNNKTKICKFCGADVSKARIIKTNNKTNFVNKELRNQVGLSKGEVVTDSLKVDASKIESVNKISSNSVQDVHLKKKKKVEEKENLDIKIRNFDFGFKLKLFFVKIKECFSNKITFNNRLSYKILVLTIVCLVVLGFGSYFVVDAYKNFTILENTVVVGEKATTEKIFGMGDLITYNGVDYKVVKVETSEGNSYKSPKEGNQFLVVTVYMKNNSADKIQYNYKNWTMSNSSGAEEKRIFTSVNVDTALYSGDLVIGGIKTGSMVFEQPIKDPKLRMNFYELKKDENGEEVIDKDKRIFSVSIKVPEKTDNDSLEKKNSGDSNVEVIKTSDRKDN